MINANMRQYPYYKLGGLDEYGQTQISDTPQGFVKMAIILTSQNVSNNILYADAQYIGLTHDAGVDETYIIENGKERLKVLYINPNGRLRQVYLARM